jgi:UDP-2,3-diacylglucosamine pyrophosphatase LpxH
MAANHVDRAYENAVRLPFDDNSRIVFMSDCHRGCGGWADNFAINATSFLAALRYYDRNRFTYIELGDGDELWENRRFGAITAVHHSVFTQLRNMALQSRFYMLYGNHDIVKKYRPGMMDTYCDPTQTCSCPLFPGMPVFESMILSHRTTGQELFLLHGHQADYLNDNLWQLSRFLVRYLWKPLQVVGIKAPSQATINSRAKLKTERRLMDWSEQHDAIMLAGHTHRPQFPHPGQVKYFNDGSCVHPRYITAIELERGALTLVRWSNKTKQDGTLYVGRDELGGPFNLARYDQKYSGQSVDADGNRVLDCTC